MNLNQWCEKQRPTSKLEVVREKLEFRNVPERFQDGNGDGKGCKGYGARCNNPEILGGLSFEDGRVSCYFFNLLLESFKIKNKKQKCKLHFQQN